MKKLLWWGGGIFLGLFILGSVITGREPEETGPIALDSEAWEEKAARQAWVTQMLTAPKQRQKARSRADAVETRAELEDEALIYGEAVCEPHVKQRLVSPGSAKFQRIWDVKVNLAPDGKQATLGGYVDSQNGFGALLRSHWVCIVERAGAENWVVVDLAVL